MRSGRLFAACASIRASASAAERRGWNIVCVVLESLLALVLAFALLFEDAGREGLAGGAAGGE